MSFTQEEIDKLYDAHRNFEYVEVTGCNGMGQEFCITGRIAVVTTDEFAELAGGDEFYYAGIADNAVVIDYGDVLKEPEDVYRTKHSAIMFTIPKKDETVSLLNFYISRIINKNANKVLYYDPEYYNFKEIGQSNYKAHHRKQLRNGRVPAAMDSDGQKLNSCVGKPMNIAGKNGVIYFADEVTPSGDVLLYYFDCRTFNSTLLSRNSTLEIKSGIVTEVDRNIEHQRQ